MAKLLHTARQVADLLLDYTPFAGWQVINMGAICAAESWRDGYAVNVNDSPGVVSHRSIDAGLWQINSHWWGGTAGWLVDVFDPAKNAGMAHRVWTARFNDARRRGLSWTAASEFAYQGWHVYTSGAYTRFIAEAKTAFDDAMAARGTVT